MKAQTYFFWIWTKLSWNKLLSGQDLDILIKYLLRKRFIQVLSYTFVLASWTAETRFLNYEYFSEFVSKSKYHLIDQLQNKMHFFVAESSKKYSYFYPMATSVILNIS